MFGQLTQQKPNRKLIRTMKLIPSRRTLIAVTSVALFCASIHCILAMKCPHTTGGSTQMLDSQCSQCICVNGTWTLWFLCTDTKACSGTMTDTVNTAYDIACGSEATCTIMGGACLGTNCRECTVTGSCGCGSCDGPLTNWGAPVSRTLWGGQPCSDGC